MATSEGTRDPSLDDAAKLVLRLTVGVLLLLHGVAKISGGIEPIIGILANLGVPTAFGYLVYVGEVLAPLLLIAGAWTRVAASIAAINMVVAVLLSHSGQLLSLSESGGYALELQAMYLFTAIAIALLGAGSYSVGGARGRWN